jgi:MFS family permease
MSSPSRSATFNWRNFVICLVFLASFANGIVWYFFGSVFPFIARDLGVGVSALGNVTTSFLVGVGISQIPASILSARAGPRRVAAAGTIVFSAATIVTALVPRIDFITLLRFVAGVGQALAFAPGVSLLVSLFGKTQEGFAVAMYDVFVLIGGVFGLFADAVLPLFLGWGLTLALNGILGLGVGVLLLISPSIGAQGHVDKNARTGLAAREDDERAAAEAPSTSKVSFSRIRDTILDRRIIVVGLGLFSFELASALCGNFGIYYLEGELHLSSVAAGSIAMLLPVFGIFSSIGFGKIYDRFRRSRKPLLLLTGAFTVFGIGLSAIESVNAVTASLILVGFWNAAGFMVCIATASEVARRKRGLEVLGMGMVLTISLVGSSVVSELFSSVAQTSGYTDAWLLSSILCLALLIPSWLQRT